MIDAAKCLDALRRCSTGRDVAAACLRIPDGVILGIGAQLQAECARKHFAAGAAFLELRAAALNSERDVHGLLPDWLGTELEAWRFTFSQYAAGRRAIPDPGFGGANGTPADPRRD